MSLASVDDRWGTPAIKLQSTAFSGVTGGDAMSIRVDDIRTGALRGWIVRLLLAAVLLRALIPVGYMPDFGAAAKGVFKVVICSANGFKSVVVDKDGHKIPDHSDSTQDQPCAFSGIAVAALPSIEAGPQIAPEFADASFIPRLAIDLPPSRAGPPLGSRGAPQLS